jgi:hypothetical protein
MKQLFSLYLDLKQLEWLKSEAARTGAPMAEIMRRALDAWIETQEETAYHTKGNSRGKF